MYIIYIIFFNFMYSMFECKCETYVNLRIIYMFGKKKAFCRNAFRFRLYLGTLFTASAFEFRSFITEKKKTIHCRYFCSHVEHNNL